MQRYGARRNAGALAAVFIALLLAVLIPVGAILAKAYLEAEPQESSQEEPEAPSASAPPSSSSRPKPVSKPEAEPKPEAPTPAFGLVPESEGVTPDYFDDAVFFGDSLTDGLGAYSVLGNATFIASTGVNPDSVFTKEAITLPGEEQRLTMFNALARTRPGKIYIMLGANWVGVNTGIEKKTFLTHYRAMLEQILEQQPDATVYLQSMLPVSKEYEENTNGNNLVGLTNEIINDYNAALLALAEEMQLYYLDIHSVMADDTGCLPSAETSDGMHLTPQYYTRWYDYLLTHTAPPAAGEEPEGEGQSAPDEPGKEPAEASREEPGSHTESLGDEEETALAASR